MTRRTGFPAAVERIEALVARARSHRRSGLRATAQQLVQSIMELHGAGLERMLEIWSARPARPGDAIIEQFGRDDRWSSSLLAALRAASR